MSGSQQKPWSDNPNAPKLSSYLYLGEKGYFAGSLIGTILYGIIIVLGFSCVTALFNPTLRRGEPIKWGLVSYTAVMFSIATVQTAMYFQLQSISYIDNREFPGEDAALLSPGPYGYQASIISEALSVFPSVLFFLSEWLADGFLLYRCYAIYSMNLWIMAFPCLVYFASVAMGTILTYQSVVPPAGLWSAIPYFSISLSLNVLLTLMIIIRLILHARNTRTALGITGIGGLCKTIVTMFIESCALYAVNSLLFIVPWGTHNYAENIFLFILSQTQIIAPLLIIQRVANKSALTKNTMVSGRLGSLKVENRGRSTSESGAIPDGGPMGSVNERGVNSGELIFGAQTTIDFHQDEANVPHQSDGGPGEQPGPL